MVRWHAFVSELSAESKTLISEIIVLDSDSGRFAHGCSLHGYHTGKCSVGSCGSYARVVGCDGLILEETISVGSFG